MSDTAWDHTRACVQLRRYELPDVTTLALGADHGGICFATPCVLEFRQVRERADHAVFSDGMGIALDHEALGFGTDFVAAELAPGDEELLLSREAVDIRGARSALERFLVGEIRILGSSQIADTFAQHKFAVVVNVFLDVVVIELIGDAGPASLKILQV